MPDYKQSKIYTITCENGAVYVGSTTLTLERRLSHHKSHEASSMYKYIQKNYNGDWSKSKIKLYENYPCNSKKELEKKEGEIIRLIGTINKHITGRTRKEYNNTPDRKRRERERKKKIVECDCGCIICKQYLSKHIKRNIHQELMKKQINAILLFLECF